MKTDVFQKFFRGELHWRSGTSRGRRPTVPIEKSTGWKLAGAAVAIVALLAAWRMLPLAEWTIEFASAVKGLGATGIIIFILAYAVGAVLFVPATIFTLAAGMAFGTFRGALIAGAGATLGAAMTFVIARYFMRSRMEAWFSHSRKRQAFDRAMTHGGWRVVILFRLTPTIPFSFSNYLFGLTKIRFWPFLIATAIGIVPGSLLHTYLGHLGKVVAADDRERTPLEYAFLTFALVATIVLVFYVHRLSKKQLEQLNDAQE